MRLPGASAPASSSPAPRNSGASLDNFSWSSFALPAGCSGSVPLDGRRLLGLFLFLLVLGQVGRGRVALRAENHHGNGTDVGPIIDLIPLGFLRRGDLELQGLRLADAEAVDLC